MGETPDGRMISDCDVSGGPDLGGRDVWPYVAPLAFGSLESRQARTVPRFTTEWQRRDPGRGRPPV